MLRIQRRGILREREGEELLPGQLRSLLCLAMHVMPFNTPA